MPATIIVGAQWGDEGKGRVVDWMARDADIVARFNGGDNAGHTVVAEGRTRRLSMAWLGGLAVGVITLLALGGEVDTRVATAFAAGEFAALALMAVLAVRR